MKLLRNKKDPNKALLLALSEDDYEVMVMLWNNATVRKYGLRTGFFLTVTALNEDKPEVIKLKSAYPDLVGYMIIEQAGVVTVG